MVTQQEFDDLKARVKVNEDNITDLYQQLLFRITNTVLAKTTQDIDQQLDSISSSLTAITNRLDLIQSLYSNVVTNLNKLRNDFDTYTGSHP
jgi:septation ring formation regulator EzrA